LGLVDSIQLDPERKKQQLYYRHRTRSFHLALIEDLYNTPGLGTPESIEIFPSKILQLNLQSVVVNLSFKSPSAEWDAVSSALRPDFPMRKRCMAYFDDFQNAIGKEGESSGNQDHLADAILPLGFGSRARLLVKMRKEGEGEEARWRAISSVAWIGES